MLTSSCTFHVHTLVDVSLAYVTLQFLDSSFSIQLYLQDSAPLLVAAAAGQGQAAQALLAGGALVDAPSSTGGTAMIAAATDGHIQCMEVLQAHNAGRANYK